MSRKKRGGYLSITFKGDHPPRHVHIFKGKRLIARRDLTNQQVLSRAISSRIREYLRGLYEKVTTEEDSETD